MESFRSLLVSVNSESNCTELRDQFANSTAEFTKCAIQNSRPITFCENCVHSYIDIEESYEGMKKVKILLI